MGTADRASVAYESAKDDCLASAQDYEIALADLADIEAEISRQLDDLPPDDVLNLRHIASKSVLTAAPPCPVVVALK
jgi:energy-converting hydrogenase A subunit M